MELHEILEYLLLKKRFRGQDKKNNKIKCTDQLFKWLKMFTNMREKRRKKNWNLYPKCLMFFFRIKNRIDGSRCYPNFWLVEKKSRLKQPAFFVFFIPKNHNFLMAPSYRVHLFLSIYFSFQIQGDSVFGQKVIHIYLFLGLN
jgi:hypothetical protein